MRQRYFFQRKQGIKQASKTDIEPYRDELYNRLPLLLPKNIQVLCEKEDFVRFCMSSRLDHYLLALEEQLNEFQNSNTIITAMKSRYLSLDSLDVVQVHKEQLVQLEAAVRGLLKDKQKQQYKLIAQQNESLKIALAALQLEATDKMKEHIIRINEALNSHQIIHIQDQLKQSYQENISQIQEQMDLQISGLLHELRDLNAVKETLTRQLETQTKQLARRESQVSQLARKCTQLQQARQSQVVKAQKDNFQFLLNFWNRKVIFRNSKYSEVVNEEQILAQIQNHQQAKVKMSSAFRISQILQDNHSVKDFIIGCIETHSKSSISSTQMIYRHDKHHRDFGEYLKELNTPFSLVLRLQNGRICGGYCPGFSSTKQSFLFTYLSEGIVINMNAKNQGSKGCSFTNNQLVFGFNQLIINNNQKGKQIKINCSSFGTKYFEKLSRFAEISENNTCKFLELEIHAILLDE